MIFLIVGIAAVVIGLITAVITLGVRIPWAPVWHIAKWAVPTLVVLGLISWGVWVWAHARPSGSGGPKTPAAPTLPKPVDLAPVLADVRASMKVFRELSAVTEETIALSATNPIYTGVSLLGAGNGKLIAMWPGGIAAWPNQRFNIISETGQPCEVGSRTSFTIEPNDDVVILHRIGRAAGDEKMQFEINFPSGYDGIRTFKQADTTGDWLWGKLPPRTLQWAASLHLRNADGTPLIGKLPPVLVLDRLAGPGKLIKKGYDWPANNVLHLKSTDVPVGQDFLVLSTDGPWKMFVTLVIKK